MNLVLKDKEPNITLEKLSKTKTKTKTKNNIKTNCKLIKERNASRQK